VLSKPAVALDRSSLDRDRENWTDVARFWYTKAGDRSPDVGRLYDHLAILARPNPLQQLSLYSRSLISVKAFNSARESVLTLFNPLNRAEASSSQFFQIDTFSIKDHTLLSKKEQPEAFIQYRDSPLEHFGPYIDRVTAKWREQCHSIAIAFNVSRFDYRTKSPLHRVFELGFWKLEQATRTSIRSSAMDPQNQAENTDGHFKNGRSRTFAESIKNYQRKLQ